MKKKIKEMYEEAKGKINQEQKKKRLNFFGEFLETVKKWYIKENE